MRVAIFVHCYYPSHFYGTEAYARSLARGLTARGHQPIIVTATLTGEPRQNSFVEERLYEDVPVISIDRNLQPNTRVRDTYDQPDLRPVHERILRKIAPDVVHVCHLINHTASLLEVATALDLPVFATFTDFFGICFTNTLQTEDGVLCGGPNWSRTNCLACGLARIAASSPALQMVNLPLLRPIALAVIANLPSLAGPWRKEVVDMTDRPDRLRHAYKAYRAAIAPTPFLHEAYRRNGYTGPLLLSRFGIDIDRSPKPARTHRVLRIGFIGQLNPHKGVHVLLEALAIAGRAQLMIWGDETGNPAYALKLRRLAEGLDVTFRGTFPVTEIARIFGEIDVLAIPSVWYENSPMILLQALATHTPVIVSDVAGLRDLVAVGTSGFTFPVGDASALAAILSAFIEDPELAVRMSTTTAYERDESAMVDDVLDMYMQNGMSLH